MTQSAASSTSPQDLASRPLPELVRALRSLTLRRSALTASALLCGLAGLASCLAGLGAGFVTLRSLLSAPARAAGAEDFFLLCVLIALIVSVILGVVGVIVNVCDAGLRIAMDWADHLDRRIHPLQEILTARAAELAAMEESTALAKAVDHAAEPELPSARRL